MEHSAILSTFINLPFVGENKVIKAKKQKQLPFVIKKIFVLSIFEWPLKTGFTVINFETKLNRKFHCEQLHNFFKINYFR